MFSPFAVSVVHVDVVLERREEGGGRILGQGGEREGREGGERGGGRGEGEIERERDEVHDYEMPR